MILMLSIIFFRGGGIFNDNCFEPARIGDFVHLNLFMPSFFIGMITSILAVENVRQVNQCFTKVGYQAPFFCALKMFSMKTSLSIQAESFYSSRVFLFHFQVDRILLRLDNNSAVLHSKRTKRRIALQLIGFYGFQIGMQGKRAPDGLNQQNC